LFGKNWPITRNILWHPEQKQHKQISLLVNGEKLLAEWDGRRVEIKAFLTRAPHGEAVG